MTIHLNDYKFMERIFYIITNLMGIKPRIQIHQFFKYGYAEQKMMMCVDTIHRVRGLAKEIRINQSLNSARKQITRSMSKSRSASPSKFSTTKLKIRHQTLAEIQEDMRKDFQTQTQKEAQKHLNKKVKRSKQESLECSMRLTGHKDFQTINRHRFPDEYSPEREENSLLQDTDPSKQISSLPLRFRGVKTAIEQEKTYTHHIVTPPNEQVETFAQPVEQLPQVEPQLQVYASKVIDARKEVEQLVHEAAPAESEQTASFKETPVAPSASKSDLKTNILLQLKQSIDQMNNRMTSFETHLTEKIEKLEDNYTHLNQRIDKI